MEVTKNGRIFYLLDPNKGLGEKLLETRHEIDAFDWKLSPDGKSIAFIPDGDFSKIEVLRLDNQAPLTITIKGTTFLYNQTWSADSRHLYVIAVFEQKPSQILRVDFDGRFKALLTGQKGHAFDSLDVSPDDHYLIYNTVSEESNVVLLENP